MEPYQPPESELRECPVSEDFDFEISTRGYRGPDYGFGLRSLSVNKQNNFGYLCILIMKRLIHNASRFQPKYVYLLVE